MFPSKAPYQRGIAMNKSRVEDYARLAVEGADYGSEIHVRHPVGSLTHRDLNDTPIVFDLRNTWAYGQELIKKIVAETTSASFQRRVTYMEENSV